MTGTINFKLTYIQARRAATALSSVVHDMDQGRPDKWWEQPSTDNITVLDQRYRAELENAWDAIMNQLRGQQ